MGDKLSSATTRLLLAANGDDRQVLDDACQASALEGSVLWQALIALGLQDLIASARGRAASAPGRLRHALSAFDAFATRKFIHHLRDEHFGDVPLDQALRWHKMAAGPAAVGLASLEETRCRGPVGVGS